MAQDATEDQAPGWRANRVAVRCTAGWAAWLGGLSLWCRVGTSDLIEQALYRFADGAGYTTPRPPRIDRRRTGGTPQD